MDLSKLSLGQKILGGTSILLIIGLFALPWHNVDLGVVSASATAIESPNGFWGVLALLLTIAILAVTAVRVFSPDTKLPELPVTWTKATLFAAAAVVVILLLKLIMETDYLGFGAFINILLAAGMTYGAFDADKNAA